MLGSLSFFKTLTFRNTNGTQGYTIKFMLLRLARSFICIEREIVIFIIYLQIKYKKIIFAEK